MRRSLWAIAVTAGVACLAVFYTIYFSFVVNNQPAAVELVTSIASFSADYHNMFKRHLDDVVARSTVFVHSRVDQVFGDVDGPFDPTYDADADLKLPNIVVSLYSMPSTYNTKLKWASETWIPHLPTNSLMVSTIPS